MKLIQTCQDKPTHDHRAHSHIVDIFQYVALQQAVCTYSKIHSAGPGVPREARAETPHRLQVVEQFTLRARCLKSNMYKFSAVSQQQERHCICELLRATTVTLQPQKTLQTPSEQPNKGNLNFQLNFAPNPSFKDGLFWLGWYLQFTLSHPKSVECFSLQPEWFSVSVIVHQAVQAVLFTFYRHWI